MLTDTVIRAAKPAEKPRKLFDEKGLYLVVMPSGGRLWRFKYRFPSGGPHRKERLLALGSSVFFLRLLQLIHLNRLFSPVLYSPRADSLANHGPRHVI
jgi:hypothetical protein